MIMIAFSRKKGLMLLIIKLITERLSESENYIEYAIIIMNTLRKRSHSIPCREYHQWVDPHNDELVHALPQRLLLKNVNL